MSIEFSRAECLCATTLPVQATPPASSRGGHGDAEAVGRRVLAHDIDGVGGDAALRLVGELDAPRRITPVAIGRQAFAVKEHEQVEQ
jgi:hypothetical protein